MSAKLLVSNLSRETSASDLANYFNGIGLVLSTSISVDERTGASLRSGFVYMTEAGAQDAVRILSGTTLRDQQITVSIVE